jgi:hypothetical protein
MFKRAVRSLVVVAAVSLSIPGAIVAQAPASVCVDGTTSSATGKGACSGHGGVDAKAAAKKSASSVTCADGSTSKAGRGACSGHGGVKPANATAAPSAAPSAAPAKPNASTTTAGIKAAPKKGGNDDPTDATAQCKDGTYSHAKTHQGACSRHGGVAKFLKS